METSFFRGFLKEKEKVKIRPLWDGNTLSLLLYVLFINVKIRPLWDGNDSKKEYKWQFIGRLKSDHCGMETCINR